MKRSKPRAKISTVRYGICEPTWTGGPYTPGNELPEILFQETNRNSTLPLYVTEGLACFELYVANLSTSNRNVRFLIFIAVFLPPFCQGWEDWQTFFSKGDQQNVNGFLKARKYGCTFFSGTKNAVWYTTQTVLKLGQGQAAVLCRLAKRTLDVAQGGLYDKAWQ